MSGRGEAEAGSEETHGSQAPQGPVPRQPSRPSLASGSAGEDDANLPARAGEARLAEPVVRMGLFGVQGTPDTSGYGLLRVHRPPPIASPRPYGSYFDAVADALNARLRPPGSGSPTRSSA